MEENKFKDKENAEKDKKTPGDDGIIEKKYFITFKNKDIEKKKNLLSNILCNLNPGKYLTKMIY